MDIDKLFDTIALPAESPLEKILQTEISTSGSSES